MKKDRKGNCGCYVYRHIRHDTNVVFYIGIGSGYDYQRAFQTCKRNILWNNIVKKTTYTVEILMDKLSRNQAEEKEKEFIALYGIRGNGGTLCNMTLGGDGSYGLVGILSPNYGKKYSPERVENTRQAVLASITDEVRQKLSNAARNRIVSEETKAKLKSIALRGAKHPMYGKPLSEATKQKLREKNIGKKMSEEAKLKISKAFKGRILSESHKKKISDATFKRWNEYKNKQNSVKNMKLMQVPAKNDPSNRKRLSPQPSLA